MNMPATAADGLEVYRPGSDRYRRATSPDNSSGAQHPAAVVAPASGAQVAAAVRLAAERGWLIAPQATGHGAAGDIGPDTLLADTSALTGITIDPAAQTARVGAGVTWAPVEQAAEPHGLLGRAGTSPTVGVAGDTFGGGVGWLIRPHGLAAAHLTAVDFVDAEGRQRRAAQDAADPADHGAWWAFRGGGGAGIATSLEFGLVPVANLWAGYLLWPAAELAAVAGAWAGALPAFGAALTTCLSLLHAPPGPPFPPELQGQPVVHLSLASSDGPDEAAALFAALGSAAAPVVSTWGPSDAARLGGIHLDPPAGVPAVGGGRWLGAGAPALAGEILHTGLAAGTPLAMIEIRHVDDPDPAADGAMTHAPGPFLVHAVGVAAEPAARASVDQALQTVWQAAAPADTGHAAPPFAEGQRSPGSPLRPADHARLAAIRSAIDPHAIIRTARII